jgi:hypothetical protein
MIARATDGCQIAALDASSFADAIVATLTVPAAERERQRLAAREWVVHEMDIVAWSERILSRYEAALARR